MSIYATIWSAEIPTMWIEVTAQGVPAHVGTPTPGFGYEAGDRNLLLLEIVSRPSHLA